MLMLIFIRDLGSSLMFFGGFLALVYVATGRLSLVSVGARCSWAAPRFFASKSRHVHDRVETWLDTFSQEVVCHSAGGQVTEFVNCQGYQIAQSLFAQADGGLFGRGLRPRPARAARRRAASPGGAHRPDLRRDRQRGGPVRRGRAARARTSCSPHRGFKTATLAGGRLLEAPRHRPHGGIRAAGVRDRGGRDSRDPAHRRDAARSCPTAAARSWPTWCCWRCCWWSPTTPAPTGSRRGGLVVNRQIAQLFGLFTLLFALLVAFTSRWTVFEAGRLEDNANNRRPLLEEQQIPRGLISPATAGPCSPAALRTGRGENRDLLPRLSAGRAVRARRRLLVPPERPARARALPERRPGRQGGRVRDDPRRARGPRARGRRRGRPTWTWTASARRSPPSRAARARWWRSSRHRQGAGDGVDAGLRPEPDPRGLLAARTGTRTSPCSTAPPRRHIRRARPSRW